MNEDTFRKIVDKSTRVRTLVAEINSLVSDLRVLDVDVQITSTPMQGDPLSSAVTFGIRARVPEYKTKENSNASP